MTPLLLRSGLRQLARHPWQMALAVLGIAIAVAVVTGVDLANVSAERAFRLGVEGVAGRSTHELVAPRGLPDDLYASLRTEPEIAAELADLAMAPVVEGQVRPTVDGMAPLRLLGIDPFSEANFRGFTRNPTQGAQSGNLDDFLTRPGGVVASPELATDLGVEPGERFVVLADDREHTLTLLGLVEPTDALARRVGRDLLVADLATAQEVLGRVGQLDHIDLIVPATDGPARRERVEAPVLQSLRQILDARGLQGVEIRPKSARSDTLDQMTRAFRLNLRALGLLALLVGMFLIYNTMTFTVVERRPLIGTLRALGVTRRQVFGLVLGEATLIAVVGSLLGVLLGVLLARGLVGLVTQTINDLYFNLTVRGVELDPASLAKALALGLGGTLVATVRPAAEATRSQPRAVLQRSQLEGRVRGALPRLALLGVGCLALAAGLLAIPSKSLVLAFGGLFVLVLGVALLVPGATWLGAHGVEPLARRGLGILGSLAARGVAATLSRTGVAVAALVIAVSMTLGVGIMVESFRGTLVRWLETTLIADVYISGGSARPRGDREPLQPGVYEALVTTAGVAHASPLRTTEVPSPRPGEPHASSQLIVLDLDPRAHGMYTFLEGDPDEAWRGLESGAVLISEPYAFHHDLALGDTVALGTDRGTREFEVSGVYSSYSSDRGLVTMDRQTYDRFFDDPVIESVALFLDEGVEVDPLLPVLRQRAEEAHAAEQAHGATSPGELDLSLTPNRELRRSALEVFDRTFVITGVLRLLALVVAFLGIVGALMALQLERARELATLRAQGLTPAQVYGLVSTQTALMGLAAGLMAVPLGITLAVVLIEIINRRSFGWSMELAISPATLVQTVVLALVAALLAGLYPAWKMARTTPARALREE